MSRRILKGLVGIAAVLTLFATANAENVTEPGKSVLSYRQQQVIRNEFSKIGSPAERKWQWNGVMLKKCLKPCAVRLHCGISGNSTGMQTGYFWVMQKVTA